MNPYRYSEGMSLTSRVRRSSVPEVLVEAGIVVLALFAMTYWYALTGLNDFVFMVGFPALYLGFLVALSFTSYRPGLETHEAALAAAAFMLPGFALTGVLVGFESLRGPAFLLLLAVGLWANASKRPARYGPETSLGTTSFGLGVLFGAFPHTVVTLAGTPAFEPISISLSASSMVALVFGVETPALVFAGPNFSVTVVVLQVVVGATGFVLGRLALERTWADG